MRFRLIFGAVAAAQVLIASSISSTIMAATKEEVCDNPKTDFEKVCCTETRLKADPILKMQCEAFLWPPKSPAGSAGYLPPATLSDGLPAGSVSRAPVTTSSEEQDRLDAAQRSLSRTSKEQDLGKFLREQQADGLTEGVVIIGE